MSKRLVSKNRVGPVMMAYGMRALPPPVTTARNERRLAAKKASKKRAQPHG